MFSLVYCDKTPTEIKERISIREFTTKNLNKFKTLLSECDWTDTDRNNANSAYNFFISKYTEFYNTSFPMKILKGKTLKSFRNPWLTVGLRKSISKKARLYKRFLNKPNADYKAKYKSYKNKLNHLIRIAKKQYYDMKLETSKNDLKATWKTLNEVINKRKPRSKYPSSFKSNGNNISDPAMIANRFCEYFTNIGPQSCRKNSANCVISS